MHGVLGLVLAGVLATAPLDVDCANPEAAASLIGRARLSEIEWAEDVNREAMWQAFGECSGRPEAEACRERERKRFAADLDAVMATIDSKYSQILKDFDARCRASIT